MGKEFSDDTVQQYIQKWPFDVIKSEEDEFDDRPKYKVVFKDRKKNELGTREFFPEEISAIVLKKIRESAEVKT